MQGLRRRFVVLEAFAIRVLGLAFICLGRGGFKALGLGPSAQSALQQARPTNRPSDIAIVLPIEREFQSPRRRNVSKTKNIQTKLQNNQTQTHPKQQQED